MEKKVLTVAVTGGIGSGKSYALDILKNAGYFTVSCDEVYKDLFQTQDFLVHLKRLFPSVVSGDTYFTADRKKLADIVFNDNKSLKKLDELTHPMIINECFNRVKNQGTSISFVEVPLLFEGGYQDRFDRVIIITRSIGERIESVIKRSNLSKTEIERRISAQVDYDALDKSKYLVVENDGDFKSKLLETLKKL